MGIKFSARAICGIFEFGDGGSERCGDKTSDLIQRPSLRGGGGGEMTDLPSR